MTRKELLEHVALIAECALEEHENYGGDLWEIVDQQVDGSQHVIYYNKATELLAAALPFEIDCAVETITDLGGYGPNASYWEIQIYTAYWTLHHMVSAAIATQKGT